MFSFFDKKTARWIGARGSLFFDFYLHSTLLLIAAPCQLAVRRTTIDKSQLNDWCQSFN